MISYLKSTRLPWYILALMISVTAHGTALVAMPTKEQTVQIAGGKQIKIAMMGNAIENAKISGGKIQKPPSKQNNAITKTDNNIKKWKKPLLKQNPVIAKTVSKSAPSVESTQNDRSQPSSPPTEESISQAKSKTVKKLNKKIKPRTKKGIGGKNKGNTKKGEADGQKNALSAKKKTNKGVSSSAGNAAASNYSGEVQRKIARTARRLQPPKMSISGKKMAVVKFTVKTSGHVSSISLSKSTGAEKLDRIALRAVKQASPLPAIPKSANKNKWVFSIPIHFR